MLKYVEKILTAVIEFGTKESQETAQLILDDLTTIQFGVLHQELDSISFLEYLAGNMFLADAIEIAINNMSKIYSVNRVECFVYEKPEHYDGLTDYRGYEALFESYMDSLDELHYYQDDYEKESRYDDGIIEYRDDEEKFESYHYDGYYDYRDEILNNKQKGNNQ